MRDTSLPMSDEKPELREAELRQRRTDLAYDYTRFPGIAMLHTVPRWAHPDDAWLDQVAETIISIAENNTRVDGTISRAHPEHPDHHEFRELLLSAEHGGAKAAFGALIEIVEGADRGTERAHSLEEYQDLFVTLPVPPSARDFATDLSFARMRLAGPNPMMLHRIDRLPDHFPVGEAEVTRARGGLVAQGIDVDGLDLASALAEGRAFLTDYAAVDGLDRGSWAGGPKYLAAPIALFITAGADRALLPVAIQVAQKPDPASPVLTPADGIRWAMAKTMATVADGNVHQAVVHLAHTHLVVEACALAAFRNLPSSHPVHHLLAPHFEGSFYINDAAESKLTSPGGGVDLVMAARIEVSRQVAIRGVQTWDFAGSMLERNLRSRGVDDVETLPDYPYRDDARLVRGAIRDWVEAFLRLWYCGDEMVRQDTEVQAMFRELGAAEGGRIQGVPAITGVFALTEALTHIIFTGSAQHAAVNFPQRPIMSFAPAFPLAGYLPGPRPQAELADWLALLPPLRLAQLQCALGSLLGGVHHTQLGRYHPGFLRNFARDGRTDAPRDALRERLEDIERTIAGRNLGRVPYDHLRPSMIPQSVNI